MATVDSPGPKAKGYRWPFRSRTTTSHDFERSQWQRGYNINLTYLVYRWCVGVQFVAVLFCSLADIDRYYSATDHNWKWPIFFTNWVYLVCTVQSLLGLWIVSAAYLDPDTKTDFASNAMPLLYKLYWVFHTVAADASLSITIIFWVKVYNPQENLLDAITFLVHGVNAVIMLIDMLVVKHANPLCHSIYTVIFGCMYILFTYIYYAYGGTGTRGRPYIYSALDWRYPENAAIFWIYNVLLTIIIHLIMWMLSSMTYWISRRWQKPESEHSSSEEPSTEMSELQWYGA